MRIRSSSYRRQSDGMPRIRGSLHGYRHCGFVVRIEPAILHDRPRPARMKTCLGMLAVVFLTAPLTGCSGMQIRSDHDSSFDFSSLRTYAWVPDARPNTGDPRVDEQFLDEHVRRSVDRVLASTGFSRIEANRADFLVNYHAGVEVKLDESMSSEAHGYTEGMVGAWPRRGPDAVRRGRRLRSRV